MLHVGLIGRNINYDIELEYLVIEMKLSYEINSNCIGLFNFTDF